jgi:uncharacterized membrane protein YqiK
MPQNLTMDNLLTLLAFAGVILIAIFAIGMIVARLYNRATKERAFVRTGFGGQKVIMNGGAMILPVLHETIQVNMNTLRLEVQRANAEALITKDRMRVDITAAFYVRVAPNEDAIAIAAQTLGLKTMHPEELRELVEGKFVDSLRTVAAEMSLQDLQDQRIRFVQKVQASVADDLHKNGLELETVSLTSLDQTKIEFFNPQNAFDAEGLTRLTEQIQERRQQRNEIEQTTEVAVRTKNLEAERLKLEIIKQEELAKLMQQQEIATRRAAQMAEIAVQQAEKEREAQMAEISAKQQVDTSRIQAERLVKEKEVEKGQAVQTVEISAARAVELERISKDQALKEGEIGQQKAIQLADQTRLIEVALKSKDQSVAETVASQARAHAVQAEEQVVTVRETAKAERQKSVVLVEARREAEQRAIDVTVAAEAEKNAAIDKAAAVTTLAQGEADAEKVRADATRVRAVVEAEAKRIMNEALNLLSPEQIAMQVRIELLRHLPLIIRESVKPMEQIDGIKIIQLNGMPGTVGGDGQASNSPTGGNLADQMVASALRYRGQAPLIDALLKEIGVDGGSLAGLTAPLAPEGSTTAPAGKDSPKAKS